MCPCPARKVAVPCEQACDDFFNKPQCSLLDGYLFFAFVLVFNPCLYAVSLIPYKYLLTSDWLIGTTMPETLGLDDVTSIETKSLPRRPQTRHDMMPFFFSFPPCILHSTPQQRPGRKRDRRTAPHRTASHRIAVPFPVYGGIRYPSRGIR